MVDASIKTKPAASVGKTDWDSMRHS